MPWFLELIVSKNASSLHELLNLWNKSAGVFISGIPVNLFYLPRILLHS